MLWQLFWAGSSITILVAGTNRQDRVSAEPYTHRLTNQPCI